jgi:hypothetical protein
MKEVRRMLDESDNQEVPTAKVALQEDDGQLRGTVAGEGGEARAVIGETHARTVTSLLLDEFPSTTDAFWPGLSEYPASALPQGAANRFFAGAIVDFQIRAEVAFENGRRLAEDVAGDPDHMWSIIASIPFSQWQAMHAQPATRMHKFRWAHERVHAIARSLAEDYGDDVRRLWNDGADNEQIMARLDGLGNKGVGPQLSRMILGALLDTGHVLPPCDIKPDTQARRVLGRLFGLGRSMTVDEALDVTRRLHPSNPWDLDAGLYFTGKFVCRPQHPRCEDCVLARACLFVTGIGSVGPGCTP